jgi:hypothetical protein
MSVSSKWYVTKVEGQQVTLFPVCRGVENREWASATPAGSMTMYITNEAALSQFIVGEEYLTRFDFAAKPKPGDGHPVDVVEQAGWNPQTGKNDKVYWVCGTCGSYASLNDDGTPNWSKHEEMFGTQEG